MFKILKLTSMLYFFKISIALLFVIFEFTVGPEPMNFGSSPGISEIA